MSAVKEGMTILSRGLLSMKRETTDRLALLLSLGSGASALIYQLALVRFISLVIGGTVLAMSSVLIAYLGGIAIGSYVLGLRGDRTHGRWGLYAILEIGIAGTVLMWMAARPLWDFLSGPLSTPLLFAVISVSILPATILMGGTLPVLSRCLGRDSTGRVIRNLYTFNVIGAAAGCLLASWWLIPVAGNMLTVLIAAAINLAIAVISWRVARRSFTAEPPPPGPDAPIHLPTPVRPLYLAAAAISGAGFLSAEVAWTRLLVNVASSSALVVGTVIGGALLGVALGSAAISLRLFRQHPARLIGPLFLAGAVMLACSNPLLNFATATLAGYVNDQSGDIGKGTIVLCLVSLTLLIALFCTVLSTVFPLLLQGVSCPPAARGGIVGRLLAGNTLGAMLGIALTALYGIPALGAAGCLLVIAIAYNFIAIPMMPGRITKGASLLTLLGLTLLVPSHLQRPRSFWIHAGITHYRRVDASDIRFMQEGREATTAVSLIDSHLALSVNGLIVAETSRSDLWDLLLKAHLPLMIHPEPQRVAVVGLGAAISLGAVTSHADVKLIDCVEISPGVVAAHRRFSLWNHSPENDPRVTIHLADGRHFLKSRPGMYDVVTVDPVDPPVCNLYTVEFYQIARRSLRPGGLMVQWVPLFRLSDGHFRSLLATYTAVFPQATLWYDGTSVLLIAHADRPLTIDPVVFSQRASEPSVRYSLEMIGAPDAGMLVSTFLCGPDQLRRFTRGATVNHDDRPTLEYRAILTGQGGRRSQANNLEAVLSLAAPFSQVVDGHKGVAGTRTPLHFRSTLVRLGQARVARLRGNHERADRLLSGVMEEEGLTKADLQQLSPFHGGR
jgi:spermidine synthase